MIEKEFIKNIVDTALTDTSMFLVDVSINPGNVIIVEVDDDEGVSIDDCVKLSKTIESNLDREAEDFELEVGSAGLTSPLKTPRQYKKYEGSEVEVLLTKGLKLKGTLASSDEEGFVLVTEKMVKPEGAKRKVAVQEEHRFSYSDVKYTKYIISLK